MILIETTVIYENLHAHKSRVVWLHQQYKLLKIRSTDTKALSILYSILYDRPVNILIALLSANFYAHILCF